MRIAGLCSGLVFLVAAAGCERPSQSERGHYASDMLRESTGSAAYDEDELCSRDLSKVSDALEASNVRPSGDANSRVYYWAAIADCANQIGNLVYYAEAIDLVILSALDVEPSNEVSELLFSLTDNGRVGIGRACLLFKLAERLAVNKTPEPYSRFGEAQTMNRFACRNLDVRSIKRMSR